MSRTAVIAGQGALASAVIAALDAPLVYALEGFAPEGVEAQRIPIAIAAHSRMLEGILKPFGDYLRSIALHAPQIPLVSNRTGTMMTAEQATDPDYWVGHLRNTILFAEGLSTLAAQRSARIYIEVGPGKALASLAGQHATVTPNQVLGSLRHQNDRVADDAYFQAMLGRVWATGGDFDWDQVWAGAAVLAPLRDSRDLGVPIEWGSVHRLPEHARFHHAAHVHAGVACETCHGQVWTMEQTVKARTMSMGWCLDCHRGPEAQQRPVGAVLGRAPTPAAADPTGHRPGGEGAFWARHAEAALSPLTRCSTCHR